MKELLNVVNDNDEVIGEKTREEIHRDGLLHREIHVYFVTPQGELIFQHRAKDKDMYPDLLDITVGGHVEIGDSYEESAIKEAEEETGVIINASDLIFVNKIRVQSEDKATGKINNTFGETYLYLFNGHVEDLKIEEGKALGFEAWPMEKLLSLSDSESSRFIPVILEFAKTYLTEFINNLKS